jgi:hypothetical protein
MHPISKRIVLSWIATDIVWASLFIYVEKHKAQQRERAG